MTLLEYLHTRCNITTLLQDAEAIELFCAVDLAQLRSAFFSVCVPPPDYRPPPGLAMPRQSPALEHEPDTYPFRCPLEIGGQKCGAGFMTYKALVQHMVHSNSDAHGIRHYARFITRTNQCVHCRSTFKSREIAQDHAAESERTGTCPTSRSKYDLRVNPITDMQCVICGHTCKDHGDMQSHLAQHSLRPPQFYNVPSHRHGCMDDSRVFQRQARSKPATGRSAQGSARRRGTPSPEHGQRAFRSSSSRSTTTVTAAVFEVAKLVADKRARQHGSDRIHVDAIAANLAASSRFREYNLLHTYATNQQPSLHQAGRSIPELPPRGSAE